MKNFKKVKNIDLSFNNINNIDSLKDIFESNIQIQKINLSNNKIKNVEIIKKTLSSNILEINLDNNNVIQKEIEEIKNLIKSNNKLLIDEKTGDFRDHYEILDQLGKSSCSIVYKIKSKVNNQLKAIKIIDKKKN